MPKIIKIDQMFRGVIQKIKIAQFLWTMVYISRTKLINTMHSYTRKTVEYICVKYVPRWLKRFFVTCSKLYNELNTYICTTNISQISEFNRTYDTNLKSSGHAFVHKMPHFLVV